MSSVLTMVTPATDYSILSLSELRQAIGLDMDDITYDLQLTQVGLQIADIIASLCIVPQIAAARKTIKQETITETFFPSSWVNGLLLAKRPVTEITSIFTPTDTIDPTTYMINPSSGIIYRLDNDCWSVWPRLSVTYTCGWADVPYEIKLAASKLVASIWQESSRDSSVKRDRVEGIGETEYWSAQSSVIPSTVTDLLAPFKNVIIG
jgi:hypothetical protein